MKKFFKARKNILLSNLLILVMLGLHLSIYEGHVNGNMRDILSPLMMQTDAPVDLHELLLCEQESKQPGYFSPFQAVEFHYQVIINEETGEYSDCAIIEGSDSIFWKGELKPLAGDPKDYWGGTDSDEGPFMRPLVGTEAPNVLFFFVQYLLFAGWIYLIVKPELRFPWKSKKESL